MGRGGAAAVAAAGTDAARLGALVVVLGPLAGAILDADRQLTCVRVEARGTAGRSAAAREALETSAKDRLGLSLTWAWSRAPRQDLLRA